MASLFYQKAASAASYIFPVIGHNSFSNDFNAMRSNGPHHAIDIIADKRQKIVSRTDGLVTFVAYPQPSWGFAVFVKADNGYTYNYLHINNDTPGTDDGKGGGYYAYAPDIKVGNRVVKGQQIGWVGDSGNAENTVSHLHFESYDGDTAINPYDGLKNNSVHISAPNYKYPKSSSETLPYNTSFRGGASVAVGDVDNDGTDEIVTGAGKGGTYVKVFKPSGAIVSAFRPNVTSFKGGVNVAVGDVDNDGTDEIVTGAGPGGRYVKVFKLDGTLMAAFKPYDTFSGGINVAAGDTTGSTADEIITGAGKGGGPRVSIFNLAGTKLKTYYAYNPSFPWGVRVASANVDTDTAKDEVLTISQFKGTPRAKVFSPTGSSLGFSNYFAEQWWAGHYNLAASDSRVIGSLGVDRRTSFRPINGLP